MNVVAEIPQTEAETKTIIAQPYQKDFFDSPVLHPAMISAWATGKTMMGILLGMELSEESPNNLGLICRKEYTDLKDSTLRDFEKYTGLRVGKQSKDVTLPNGSVIMFRHGDELNLLKNTNLGWWLMEQAEEFETDEQFMFLKGRLRRNEAKRLKGIVIGNTAGHNWIWKYWKSAPTPDYFLAEATTFDNQINQRPEFIKQLDDIRIKQPTVYRRYVMNSWEEADISDQLIPDSFIRPCINNPLFALQYREDNRRVVSCDPARFGDDRTVIYGFKGAEVIKKEVLGQRSTMESAGYIAKMGQDIGANLYSVEATGIGAGIVDRLRELGKTVIGIEPAERSIYPERFVNLRTEIYWNAREMFEKRKVKIDLDEELIAELSSVKYKMGSDQKIRLEPKDETKKRLGKSPDLADAYCFGLYALKDAKPVKGESEGRNKLKNQVARMRAGVSKYGGW